MVSDPAHRTRMPAKRLAFDTVREIGLALPGAKEGTAYGSPALKVRDQMFACIAINRSAEPDTLAVRVGFDERDELIAADPDVYYLTDHYVDYPVVLVRLGRVHPDALRGLIEAGLRFVSTKKRRPVKRRTKT